MLYIYAHSGIGIPEASNISFWNPQIFRVIDMYEQHSKNLAPYLYSTYKSTVAHEFGHTLGLGDAYKTNDDGKVLGTNSEVSNAQGAGNIMYYNDKVYTNDIEMVLEAYVQENINTILIDIMLIFGSIRILQVRTNLPL